jgi:hypothetical protein
MLRDRKQIQQGNLMDLQIQPKKLAERVVALLKNPTQTWSEIRREPVGDFWDIFPDLALLAAIPPLMGAFYGLLVSGATFLSLLLLAPLAWAILMGGVWAVSYGIFAFAPYLESRADLSQSLKLMTWGLAPLWLSSIVMFPYFGIGIIARIAGMGAACYLWVYGFPRLLSTPKKPPTTLALLIASAGFSYSTLTYLLQQILITYLLQPIIIQIFI